LGEIKGLIKVLTNEEMELLHRATVEVLSEIGMKINCEEALDYLSSYGCKVERSTKIVKFPPNIVEKAIHAMKKSYLVQKEELKMPVRYTQIYFSTRARKLHNDFTTSTGGFPVYIYDLDNKRRKANLEDVISSIRLADALNNIDLIGLSCSAQEIPPSDCPIVMTGLLLKNTSKLGGIETWTKKDVKYIYEMAIVVSGDRERLRKKPILVGYAEAKSPLCIDKNMAEVLIEYVKMGIPQSLDTMPCGGITAPATSAGTLVLGLAETLGGLVLGYAVNPNAVLSVDITPGLGDMKYGTFPYAGPDRFALLVGAIQMVSEYYGCPSGTHGGKTDACFPGVQAGFEKALSIIYPILAGATGIGTIGQIENGTTFSPLQLVIDNEIITYIKRTLQGFEVNKNTIALEVIKEVGIGGSYLSHPHTAVNFRKEFWLSDLTERMPWDVWEQEQFRGLEEKAKTKAKKMLKGHYNQPLSQDQQKEIDKIVKLALRESPTGDLTERILKEKELI